MAKKEQLAALIESLTPTERKYFKQYTALRSDDKSYVRLFNCVLRDGTFNAAKLGKELNKSAANLAHEKEYLKDIILKALRNYNDKLPEVELYNSQATTAILNEKGLFGLASIYNSKVTNLAVKQNRFDVLWRTSYNDEYISYRTTSLTTYLKKRQTLGRQMTQHAQQLKTFTDFYCLSIGVDAVYATRVLNHTAAEMAETKKLLNHRLLKTKMQEPLLRSFQLEMLSKLYQMERNKKKAFAFATENLLLLEKNPEALQLTSQTYFTAVHSYITDFISLTGATDLTGFEKIFSGLKNRYRKLPLNQSYLHKMFGAYKYVYYFTLYHRLLLQGGVPVQAIKKMISNFESDEKKMQQQLSNSQLDACFSRAGALCFIMADYQAALGWFHKILNQPKTKANADLTYKAKMGVLLTHAQLKNYSILPHLCKSMQRYLAQTHRLQKVERLTLALLGQLAKLITEAAQKKAFAQYKQQLAIVKAADTLDKRSLNIFFYELWADMNL